MPLAKNRARLLANGARGRLDLLPVRVILFDIDGTLISTGGAGRAALEAALPTAFGLPAEFPNISLGGRTDRAIARDVLLHFGLDDTAENWNRYQRAYLEHLPECLHKLRGRVLPGMAEAVAEIGRRGNALVGLLTGNVVAGAQCKLGFFGLWEYFPFGGFGDRHVDRADVAREALAAAERHGQQTLSPDEVWVVGDTPLDVACARAIGAKAVAVATGGVDRAALAAAKPDLLLDDFSQWRELAILD